MQDVYWPIIMSSISHIHLTHDSGPLGRHEKDGHYMASQHYFHDKKGASVRGTHAIDQLVDSGQGGFSNYFIPPLPFGTVCH